MSRPGKTQDHLLLHLRRVDPGKSHQSLRDVSLFGALLQPANTAETRMVVDYAVQVATQR